MPDVDYVEPEGFNETNTMKMETSTQGSDIPRELIGNKETPGVLNEDEFEEDDDSEQNEGGMDALQVETETPNGLNDNADFQNELKNEQKVIDVVMDDIVTHVETCKD